MAKATAMPPGNPIDILPASKTQYLETHYKMCRYEAIEPLREAVAEFRENPQRIEVEKSKALIYTKVKPAGLLLSKQGACIRISFLTERAPSPINWQDSERLTPGAIVALSPSHDCFRTKCIVATVATRSFNGKAAPEPADGDNIWQLPCIELFFSDPSDVPFHPLEEYVMLEASMGYFENVRYTMLGLQQAALYRYVPSLQPPFLSSSLCIEPAAAASKETVVPRGASSFDASQKEAFDTMTRQEFSIVQGPPGTGKTYTSVMAIQSYVETLKKASPKSRPPPIVIAAQTNHALDQILELCIDRKAGEVVRLGGQSRSHFVAQKSMFNLRSQSKFRTQDFKGQASWRQICSAIEDQIEVYSRDVVCADELRDAGLITPEQYQSLLDGYASGSEADECNPADDDEYSAKFKCILDWASSFSQQSESVDVFSMLPGRFKGLIEGRVDDTRDGDTDGEGQARRGKGPDDASFHHRGVYIPLAPQDTIVPPPIGRRKTDSWRNESKQLLKKHSDLYTISQGERAKVLYYLKMQMRDRAIEGIQEHLHIYRDVCETLKINRWVNSIEVIEAEGIQIIGCTTTGLSKYRGLLAGLMPRIMLIEEAAETREAHIAAAMFPSLEQLVLVGDHQQLVPQVDMQFLAGQPYNLKVSMFERLVKLGLPYKTLQVQRRMVPRIREVVQTFYPMLQDHPSVLNARARPPVQGMGATSLWWFRHDQAHTLGKKRSLTNFHEAEMIVGFIRYLMVNNVEPHQVTVLTYYSAQVELINQLISHDPMLNKIQPAWSVRTVDGFQGEENDIILLSTVRSSAANENRLEAGFVEDENRAVVAMSRARRGLFVFGNTRNLLESTPQSKATWQKVITAFGTQIGDYLPVTCGPHGNITPISTAKQWLDIASGGCLKPCNKSCPNGHECANQCHARDVGHATLCKKPCPKWLTCGHHCAKLCNQRCSCEREPAVLERLIELEDQQAEGQQAQDTQAEAQQAQVQEPLIRLETPSPRPTHVTIGPLGIIRQRFVETINQGYSEDKDEDKDEEHLIIFD
ncbi:P-loop containing nucleoside triphosphate hydrolase protein [Trichoderma barbatum]